MMSQNKIIELRVNKIIGQLQGIKRMLKEKRDCQAVLLQISAIKAAVNKLGLEIAKNEVCALLPEHKQKLEPLLREVARI